jgi:hypothetical protein
MHSQRFCGLIASRKRDLSSVADASVIPLAKSLPAQARRARGRRAASPPHSGTMTRRHSTPQIRSRRATAYAIGAPSNALRRRSGCRRRAPSPGVVFDRNAAAPSTSGSKLRTVADASYMPARRRILHARGDTTGREIMRVLIAAVRRTAPITVLEGVEASRATAVTSVTVLPCPLSRAARG